MSRWNWLWLAPVCVLALFVVELHTLPYGLQILKLGWQRWNWGGLFSPSAYFCWSVIIASVITPIKGLILAIATVVSSERDTGTGMRYLQSMLIIIAVLLIPFVTDALATAGAVRTASPF